MVFDNRFICGYPIDENSIDPKWGAEFREVAKNKNLYCKVSALLNDNAHAAYHLPTTD